jgi:hypothetical protein
MFEPATNDVRDGRTISSVATNDAGVLIETTPKIAPCLSLLAQRGSQSGGN